MKGLTEIISELILIFIAISILTISFYFYQTTIHKSGEEIEREGENIYCTQSSNFIILDVNGMNITIKNNGGSKLNLDSFRVYINGENATINYIEETGSKNEILEIGEIVTIILETSTHTQDRVRVMGECRTGDEIIVK